MTNPITTLSRERLENLASGDAFYCIQDDEGKELARALLAVMDAKPVAFRWEGKESGNIRYDGLKPLGVISQPLFTIPPVPSAPDGWIKCSDRMPEHNQQVLTWNGQYKASDLCLSGRFLCLKPDLVTHWMPLPAAPGGD